MVFKKLIQLDREQIEKITKLFQSKNFESQTSLFYEGQTPVVAFLIVEGSVNLVKNKKIKSTLHEGSLIGLKELMNNKPSHVSAEVTANTSLCYLDKSTIIEIIKNQKNELSSLFKSICELKAS